VAEGTRIELRALPEATKHAGNSPFIMMFSYRLKHTVEGKPWVVPICLQIDEYSGKVKAKAADEVGKDQARARRG
jgi:hypothetical protein